MSERPTRPVPSHGLETLSVHGGERRPRIEGSVVYPVFQGTVFEVPQGTGYDDIRYIRLNTNPTQTYLGDKLAALEGAEAGLATASGMAAFSSILLALLKEGDHVLAGDSCYGGTYSFLTAHARDLGWRFTFVDPVRPETWAKAIEPRSKVFLLETITNPLIRVPRLNQAVAFCREHGLVSVIDNTVASPVNFRPLLHGFDLVYHSATKYLNGHSDIVGGAVMGSAERVEQVRRTLNHFGGSIDPHAAYLMARGLKTLALRVAAQNRNAMALATALDAHPAVAAVHYPGLRSHPDHGHARELLAGFGGLLSFRVKGGADAAERLLAAVTIPAVAPSLGGVETLITRPATTSHASMSPEERARMGVGDDLVRVSAGIEGAADLVADFTRALDRLG